MKSRPTVSVKIYPDKLIKKIVAVLLKHYVLQWGRYMSSQLTVHFLVIYFSYLVDVFVCGVLCLVEI